MSKKSVCGYKVFMKWRGGINPSPGKQHEPQHVFHRPLYSFPSYKCMFCAA